MLYNRTGEVYCYARDAKGVSAFTLNATIRCKLEPLTQGEGFDGSSMYNQVKLYTEYSGLKNGQKIVVDSITYVVSEVKVWKGIRGEYYIALVNKSDGT